VDFSQKSQFALAIIQTLLTSNGASAFQTIESVNFPTFYYCDDFSSFNPDNQQYLKRNN